MVEHSHVLVMSQISKLRTIRLYGVLGARFGREFRLSVANAAEAVRALSVQLPGFRNFLRDAHHQGLTFAVFAGSRNLTREQLEDPPGDDIVRIAPVYAGSKRAGVLQTIVGAVLIVAGVLLLSYGIGAPMVKMGIAMVAGGVVQMLSPQPPGLSAKESPENTPSYSMDGIANTQAGGGPVPVAYGGHDIKGMFVGSAVISGGIYAEDQA